MHSKSLRHYALWTEVSTKSWRDGQKFIPRWFAEILTIISTVKSSEMWKIYVLTQSTIKKNWSLWDNSSTVLMRISLLLAGACNARDGTTVSQSLAYFVTCRRSDLSLWSVSWRRDAFCSLHLRNINWLRRNRLFVLINYHAAHWEQLTAIIRAANFARIFGSNIHDELRQNIVAALVSGRFNSGSTSHCIIKQVFKHHHYG